jgi:3-hydroxyisobutyrate dehydrogenase-like beta-hydroxyacid dehydrogenase
MRVALLATGTMGAGMARNLLAVAAATGGLALDGVPGAQMSTIGVEATDALAAGHGDDDFSAAVEAGRR